MLAQAVEHLIKNIVDFPDDVSVKSHENARGELIRVRVNPEDIGRVKEVYALAYPVYQNEEKSMTQAKKA